MYDYVPLTFVLDFNDPQFEKKIGRFARAHRSIEMFNEQVNKRTITIQDSDAYISKETFGILTGVSYFKTQTKKEVHSVKAKKKKKGNKAQKEEDDQTNKLSSDPLDSPDSLKVQESPQKKTKNLKKIDPFSFFEHLNNWKFDFDLEFLPQTRKEYIDPTDKFKSSIPKIDAPFNKGHNIW